MDWRKAIVGAVAGCAALGGAAEAGPGLLPPCHPITSLPYTIQEPGRYCVTRRLTFEMGGGTAINVEADDVRLSLIGGALESTRNGAVGIRAMNRQRLTIVGGRIQGFRYGILIGDSQGMSRGHLVSGVTVVDSGACGISVTGAQSTVRNNRVRRTGGATRAAVGISQAGSFSTVAGNVVRRTHATSTEGYAAGIDLTHGYHGTVAGNLVDTVEGGSPNYGIRCGEPFAALNQVVGAATPFSRCSSGSAPGPYPEPYDYPYPYPYPFDLEEAGPWGLALIGLAAAALKWAQA